MKQVLRRGLKDIVVDEVPEPKVAPHQVLVRAARSLISAGTETASIHQDSLMKEVADNPDHLKKVLAVMSQQGPARTIEEVRAKFSEYAVLGYSGAGSVAACHSTVTDLALGTRVAYGGEGTGHGELVVTGRQLVAPIPDNVSDEDAAFTTLGAIAMNTVRTADIALGETVVVLGLGLVGQLTAQLARLAGARVIAIDLLASRVTLAEQLGAEAGVTGGDGALEDVLRHTHGRGADCVIIAAAAKSAAPARAALSMVRDRGRIVIVGAVGVDFPWLPMYLKEVEVRMARAYGPGSYDPVYEQQGRDYPLPYVRWTENRNMVEFLRLLGAGSVKVAPLVSHRFTLENAPQAYATILDPGTSSLAVVLSYPSTETGAAGRPYVPQHRVVLKAPEPGHRFRVALVGAGNIVRWAHMPALRGIGDATLQAVVSGSGARAKSYARRYGAAYCTTNYDDVLADPAIDVILLGTRNDAHARQAAAALRAGKHVFVEKPVALTESECRDLSAAQQESGRELAVGFNRRFAPSYGALRQRLAGRDGPFVINCRVNSPGISGNYWMADPAIGGAILGEACHFTDLLCWLLGDEMVEVSAFALPAELTEPVPTNNLTASFRFAKGSVASLTYCTVGSATSGGERVEVFGPGFAASAHDFKHFEVRGSLLSRRSSFFPDRGYRPQLAAFFSALRQGNPAPVNLHDGIRATVSCLRILESARAGQPRTIDWRALTR
jgi:predicted dehydrogenase/threonine dehydrogenase-like Zn-dependent dehydrogenase